MVDSGGMNTKPAVTIAFASNMDRRWSPMLKFQIRNAGIFNGSLFETREAAQKFAESLVICKCGIVCRQGAPHLATCQ